MADYATDLLGKRAKEVHDKLSAAKADAGGADKRKPVLDALSAVNTAGKELNKALTDLSTSVETYRKSTPSAEEIGPLAEAESLAITELHRDLLKAAYSEAGNWARHFSTIRMAVSSFLITLGVSGLTLAWDSPHWRILSTIDLVIWGVMIVVMGYFTYLTTRKSNHQADDAEWMGLNDLFRSRNASKAKPTGESGGHRTWCWDRSFLVACLLTVGAFVLVFYVHDDTDSRSSFQLQFDRSNDKTHFKLETNHRSPSPAAKPNSAAPAKPAPTGADGSTPPHPPPPPEKHTGDSR